MAWQYPVAAAGVSLLNHMLNKGERERQQKLAQTRAKWSPFTGDQGGLNVAQQTRPTGISAALQGGVEGLALGRGVAASKAQDDISKRQMDILDNMIAKQKKQAVKAPMGQQTTDLTGDQNLQAIIQMLGQQQGGM